VWGEGSLDARLCLVGEAPGETEARLGRPFVGQAGKLLDRELEQAGIDRSAVWITNVVKCRPVAVSPTGRATNRPPNREEVDCWLPVLMKELAIIRPKVVVCLGAVAAKALIGKTFAITKQRGQWYDGPLDIKISATFHPSYILRTLAAGDKEQEESFRKDLAEARRVAGI
jgi:DNA polymerase